MYKIKYIDEDNNTQILLLPDNDYSFKNHTIMKEFLPDKTIRNIRSLMNNIIQRDNSNKCICDCYESLKKECILVEKMDKE